VLELLAALWSAGRGEAGWHLAHTGEIDDKPAREQIGQRACSRRWNHPFSPFVNHPSARWRFVRGSRIVMLRPNDEACPVGLAGSFGTLAAAID